LRRRVEELLAADAADADEANLASGREFPKAETVGTCIGRYKRLQQIGEGGCGVVFMADQEEPVRRRVALKVIKLGMDTRQVVARFEAERQALALMDHPNIAKVLDGGSTESGRPYFVMELVRGVKITDYCDTHRLSTPERLDLFVQVCHAVQHAHQKGVIHRDLKPSNILVADHDGVPVPKIIDFGIAKATTDQRLTDKTLFTAFEQFIGTPAYMSPEQARMSGLDIDTRTDIYSLGVLLYELLTGKTPFDAQDLLAAGLDEMRRTICEREPARPSTRLSTMLAEELTTTARHRRTDAPRLIHLLRGDLDWIVIKALEKDRARRYETANGLAMDIQRHLKHEPVAARPPRNLYRFQKLVRRNRLAFAAAGSVAMALIIGLAASTWEYFNERKAYQRAMYVTQVLQELLTSANPDGLNGTDYTVRRLLNDFSAYLAKSPNEFAGQPEVEATVRLSIGWTYFRLGAFSEAEPNLRRAVDLRRRALGPLHPDTLDAQQRLARLLLDGQRKWDEGGRLAREIWQARVKVLGAENPYTLASQSTYAAALSEDGQLQEAEVIQRQILQITEKTQGPDAPSTIFALGNLGQTLTHRGAYVEAERYLQEALTRFQRTGLSAQLDALLCAKEVAMLRLLRGYPADAEKVLTEALPRSIQGLGADHYVTLFIQRVLGRALADEGRLEEAEMQLKETLNAQLTNPNQERHGTARTQLYLGRVLVEKGKPDEAEALLKAALTFFRADASSESRPELAAQAANWLGAIQLGRKNFSEAETLLLSGSERLFASAAEVSPNERRLAVGHIVKLYEAWNQPEKAAAWQKKLDGVAENPTQP
jgi:eukaryotic-like serine/threonine-protein kinase